MRFKVTQRILASTNRLTWVVWDTQLSKVVSDGSYLACSNSCRELNESIPEDPRLTQSKIDGEGEHRRSFWAMLSQIRNAIKPSTQIVK